MSRALAAVVAAVAAVACAHGIDEGALGQLVASGAAGAVNDPLGGSAGVGGGGSGASASTESGSGGVTNGDAGAASVAGAAGSSLGGESGSGGGGESGSGGGSAGKAGAGGSGGSAGAAPVLGPDITSSGTPIALVTAPSGGGNHDIEVLRDNDTPPVGNMDSLRQYDTFASDPNRTQDWLGYSFATPRRFMQVVFQGGKIFVDGGWFDSIEVQVRSGGTWQPVTTKVTPAYAGAGGESFASYVFDFAPAQGDAIRIFGTPGGSMRFISCAELRVLEQK